MAVDVDIHYLKGVGPGLAKRFVLLGVRSVKALFYYFPRAYDDRRKVPLISQLVLGENQRCRGVITLVEETKTPKTRVSIVRALIKDSTGYIVALWFNQPFVKAKLKKGQLIYVRGKVDKNAYTQEVQLSVTDYELLEFEDIKNKKVVPLYALGTGLTQSKFRESVSQAFQSHVSLLVETFSDSFRQAYKLMPLIEAVKELHFPSEKQRFHQARKRIVFEELFYFQLSLAFMKMDRRQRLKAVPLATRGPLINAYTQYIPYELTKAQQRVIHEIYQDLKRPIAMNRLLQGDVGSGKTDVAVFSLLAALESGLSGSLLAPTQILAEQHYAKLLPFFESLHIPVVLLKGRMRKKERENMMALLQEPTPKVIVGTHALLEETVPLSNVGVAVIDEQHRFGVKQRMTFKTKGNTPHCLFMTATPIPRSFMLTTFGDLDKSIIDELPPGRKPQKTELVPPFRSQHMYQRCLHHLKDGHQMYVVYPLIEESKKIDLKAAVDGAEFLQQQVFPTFKVGLLHGKMKSAEKTEVMAQFKRNDIQILVSTTVIEVGVDVPNASLMIINHAERFGLSQLHQLRGRIGRGRTGDPHCFLVSDAKNEVSQARLDAFVSTTDGFKIAEFDLKFRGPGDMLGTRQSGLPDFKLADLVMDEKILISARNAAFKLVHEDPLLANHPVIKKKYDTEHDALFKGKVLN